MPASLVIGSGRAWESSKADLLCLCLGDSRVAMARGKLECQCQLFGREMIAGQKGMFELGDFNVMTEEQPALLNDGGGKKSVGGPSFT